MHIGAVVGRLGHEYAHPRDLYAREVLGLATDTLCAILNFKVEYREAVGKGEGCSIVVGSLRIGRLEEIFADVCTLAVGLGLRCVQRTRYGCGRNARIGVVGRVGVVGVVALRLIAEEFAHKVSLANTSPRNRGEAAVVFGRRAVEIEAYGIALIPNQRVGAG